jgi:hypothetical protein
MSILKKIIFIFSLLTLIDCSKKFENDLKTFSNAINAIVKDQYAGKTWHLDFYVIGDFWCQKFAKEIIDNVMKMNSKSFKSQIIYVKSHFGSRNKIKLMNSAIFFIKSEKQIISLNEQINMTNLYYTKFHHTVVLLTTPESSDLEIFKKEKRIPYDSLLNYEVFLFEQSGKIKLATIQQFDSSDCKPKLKFINEFKTKTQKWKRKELGLITVKQFNGCSIRVFNYNEHFTIVSFLLYEIYVSLQTKLNVKMEKNLEKLELDIFEKQKSSGKSIRAEQIDDIIYIGYDNEDNKLFMYKLFEIELGMIISIGREYTSYEKFLLPFDYGTWICCGVFFGGAFVIIFIIKMKRNRHVQQIVFGARVRSPAFNILVAFFGQSQNILPTRSFARFLLMSFILFCLIIRTGYQGVQFDMMYKVRSFLKFATLLNL